jgi:hypothetical protein
MPEEEGSDRPADAGVPAPDGEHGRSFVSRLWQSFDEQGGLAKVLIGVMTAVGTAAVLATGAFVADRVTGSDDAAESIGPEPSTSALPIRTVTTAPDENSQSPTSSAATTGTTTAPDQTVGDPIGVVVLDDSPDAFGQAIWGYWMDGPMPPQAQWPGPDWEEWLDTVEDVGGAYAWTAIRIVIEGIADRTVSVTDARAVKDRCVDPTPEALFWVAPEGEALTVGWEFDLSEADPRAYAVDQTGRQGRYFADRTLTVAPGEIVTIDATAVAGPLDCEWHLELDVVAGGVTSTVTVDDSGHSFRTSGDGTGTPTYALRALDGFQLWVHPDPPSAFGGGTPLEVWSWTGDDWVLTESNSLGPDR